MLVPDWMEELEALPPIEDVQGSKVPSKPKEVSPCSEYTRFTVEGTFTDPFERDKGALFDLEAMGILFLKQDWRGPKWSEKLGYGMAVIDDDTRVHLYKTGKYIIRRALDKEHAERCLGSVRSVAWPALVHRTSGRPLWWLLLSEIRNGSRGPSPEIVPLLEWDPSINDPDTAFFEALRGYSDLIEVFGSGPYVKGHLDNLYKDHLSGSPSYRLGMSSLLIGTLSLSGGNIDE